MVAMHDKSDSFLQYMEFHIHRSVREKCRFHKKLFCSTGNVILRNIDDVYAFTFQYNTAVEQGVFGQPASPEQFLKAGQLNAMGLIDEIFHYMCRLYRRDVCADFFGKGYRFTDDALQSKKLPPLDSLLTDFCTLFPPAAVYTGAMTVPEWFCGADPASGIENKYLAFEEFILFKLANENPAFEPFQPLFSDAELSAHPAYTVCWEALRDWSTRNEVFGPEQRDLISLLKAPVEYAPFSLKRQLDYIRTHWFALLGELLGRLLTGQDILSEEEKAAWHGGGGTAGSYAGMGAAQFEELSKEYERFSADYDWMPNVVMMAKSTLVWLDQLSKKYSRSITRLDQIPDEELDFLAEAGFNALWLIGVWERSAGSARIKQICGNGDAAASAYSLMDYEIADEIGGWQAVDNLRQRAISRGIRLAADMVPNHTGLDSQWVIEQPDLFIQSRESPFPSYSFNGENLSRDSRVGVYLEDHYYSRSDCAVVFKRVDHHTGDVRYIYHGNDGTGLPWNDTAQIDFLNPQAREAVIQKIMHVARNFPIIRFDAAMVLAKKHIRRLWYPEPGHGGDIASRSRYALSTKEFQQRIPEEFWREVVDRCAAEVPGTLLLAEAFWMMEGYFVRTLGMHRVYNSAFMNMLKREENAKYRLAIKNTLEFDPQILKRYVNFMNNPDEETAVAQFGRDDKYFGVCTMLVAMPGLPMFGHGQIEGFEEKYGMEYRRAYYDEQVNYGLVDRHRYEIFPLMRLRRLFSGVENFLLYDFWSSGSVNENVFAWSNAAEGARSLILYNNKYEQTAGWIKVSAAYAVKNPDGEKKLIQRTLAEGLQLACSPRHFTIFQEQHSKLWYIRESAHIAESGLFVALNGFETQVFLNIHEVEDSGDNRYRTLCSNLGGRGIADIAMAINEIRFKPLYAALSACITRDYFDGIAGLIDNGRNGTGTANLEQRIDVFLKKTAPAVSAFFSELQRAFNAYLTEQGEPIPSVKADPVKKLLSLYKARLCRFVFSASGVLEDHAQHLAPVQAIGFELFMQKLSEQKEAVSAYSGALLLFAVEDMVTHYQSPVTAHTLSAHWQLERKTAEIMASTGYILKERQSILNTVPYLCHVHGERGTKTVRRMGILRSIANDSGCINRLQLHEWDGIRWFSREGAETFADEMAILLFLYAAKPSKTAALHKSVEDAVRFRKLLEELHTAIQTSGYKTDSFIQLFSGVKKKPARRSGKSSAF